MNSGGALFTELRGLEVLLLVLPAVATTFRRLILILHELDRLFETPTPYGACRSSWKDGQTGHEVTHKRCLQTTPRPLAPQLKKVGVRVFPSRRRGRDARFWVCYSQFNFYATSSLFLRWISDSLLFA